MLGRLRKLVFNIRHRSSTPHFLESMRRLNRLARLMNNRIFDSRVAESK
jgi:hypothetical protein